MGIKLMGACSRYIKVINGKDKFFLYFANGASGIGVLTADSPIGHGPIRLGKP